MLYYISNITNHDVTFWYRGQKVTINGGYIRVLNLKHIPYELQNLVKFKAVTITISTEYKFKKNK